MTYERPSVEERLDMTAQLTPVNPSGPQPTPSPTWHRQPKD